MFHFCAQQKMGSSQYASACRSLASSYYSAMTFPACPEKGLVIALNTKLECHLFSTLNLVYLCFSNHCSLLVGSKAKKQKLGDIAYRVIANACESRKIDLGDDVYFHVYR